MHYVGSPFQQNFGEAGEAKRVGLLELDDLSLTWLPMPGFPTYHTTSFAKWQACFNPASEDRHRVVVQPREATQLFAHPHQARVCEVVHQAAEASAQVAGSQPAAGVDWLARWLEASPPGELSLAREELLEYGRELAGAGAD